MRGECTIDVQKMYRSGWCVGRYVPVTIPYGAVLNQSVWPPSSRSLWCGALHSLQ